MIDAEASAAHCPMASTWYNNMYHMVPGVRVFAVSDGAANHVA